MSSYEQLRQKIKGPIYSIITPFKEDETIDYESLGSYIKFMYDNGARIFYAMAFNTRYLLMSNKEIMDVNEFVIKTVKGLNKDNIVIVGDPLHCSTQTSIDFALHAKEHGADMISLIYRAYLFFDDHVYQHYKAVADAVDIGILVHEMPFARGRPSHQDGSWSLELIDKLAGIPNVIAMKEDAKDDDYTRKVVDTIGDRVAIITSGRGLQQWSLVADKCAGWLSGIGNVWPKTELDFYAAWQKKDTTTMKSIIDSYEKPLFEITGQFSWHLGIRAVLDLKKIMPAFERRPYVPLNDVQRASIVDILKRYEI